MIKQLALPLLGVAVFVVLVGILVKNPQKLGIKVAPTLNPNSNEQQITIKNKKIKITVADTVDERAKGLSGVSELKEDSGMLFVFDSKDVSPTFRMKDMIINLDIIWVNDGKITQIDKNVEAPLSDTPDSQLKLFKPQGVIDYVLEVPAGFSNRNNINVGDEVIIGQ